MFFNSAPSNAPIEYETVQFQANTGDDTTEFQGPSSPKTDAAWENLLDGKEYAIFKILFMLIEFALVGPGMIRIDDETARKLPHNTTRRINNEGYVGVLEMFHQLHCLVRHEFHLIIVRVPVTNQRCRTASVFSSTIIQETTSLRTRRFSKLIPVGLQIHPEQTTLTRY